MMKVTDFVRRADEILGFGNSALVTRITNPGGPARVNSNKFGLFRSASLSFLANVFGSQHPYFTDFSARVSHAYPSHTEEGIGIIAARFSFS
jgi:hypothetical protein